MVVPKSGRGWLLRPSGHVAPTVPMDGLVTEIRVHGVGGTTPEALLDDMAPEQVGGDRVAGFYRTADVAPTNDAGGTRHVEAYSWGGLTSRSGVRVLWLLLLPFLLANLAGWMYRGRVAPGGRPQGFRFACHRIASGLACLALTVNTVLVGVMIGADLIAYQAPRAGLAGRWWLWPLSWTWVRGHGERPLVIGYAAVVVVVGLVVALAVLTQSRYEAVRPPWRIDEGGTPDRPRTSAPDLAMSDPGFWDSALAVRRMTGAHVGAATGFLAVTFAVTARAAAGATLCGLGWWWLAMVAGCLALAISVGVVTADQWPRTISSPGLLDRVPARIVGHAVAPVGVVCAGIFAWRQPTMSMGPGSLPGLDRITADTYLAFGSTIALMALVGFAGLLGSWRERARRSSNGGLFGGPAVVMTLAAGLLNSMLLGALFTVGHALGRPASDSRPDPTKINVPVVVGWAGPVLGFVLVAVVLVFGVTQTIRWLAGNGVPREFDADLGEYASALPGSWPSGTKDRDWVVAMLPPPNSDVHVSDPKAGDPAVPPPDEPGRRSAWRRTLVRAYWFGTVRSSVGPLVWLISGLQVGGIVWIVAASPRSTDELFGANGTVGKIVEVLATAILLGMMYLLRAGWRDPQQRKRIGILWDVGTFWPRSYHPLAPPSYAERAVPDLQRRIWRLNDHDAPVLVVAHSQGTVLAAAALVQGDRRARAGTIGMVTFGSPLRRLYAWAFPAYFNADVLRRVGEQTHQASAKVVRWHNFWYRTDPIGGPVTDGGAPVGAIPADERLLDPATAWRIYDDPPPAPGGHSGYWTDNRVWTYIDALATDLAPDLDGRA